MPEKVARLKRLAAGKRGARPVDVTFSIDADVLEHFQRQGEDWNERINDVLRRAMNDPR
ncbi:MAG TPA: BrnA antitoxin family protein [Rhizobiaceae bacterium]|nr:BrnA antitoxin family protein [Rhizobiaceae bacterium]